LGGCVHASLTIVVGKRGFRESLALRLEYDGQLAVIVSSNHPADLPPRRVHVVGRPHAELSQSAADAGRIEDYFFCSDAISDS
jgi:hypothetical protein